MNNSSIEKNLRKLCMQPGISGNEYYTGISKCVYDMVSRIGDKTHIDDLGNVISILGKGQKRIMLDSHLDEVGFIVSRTDDETIWISPIGDIKPEVVDGNNAYVIVSKIRGNIGSKKGGLIFKPLNKEDKKRILSGDIISFERNFSVEDGNISATALDNRIGCAVLIEVMDYISKDKKILKDMSFVFVFSALEEKDCSNLDIIAGKYNPDFWIILDAAYAQPVDFDSLGMSIPELGRGFAIQYQGKDFIVSKQIVSLFEEIADRNDINFQKEIPSPMIGRTNFPQLNKSGVGGGVVNIPVASQHREKGLARISDAESAVCFIELVVKHFKNNNIGFAPEAE